MLLSGSPRENNKKHAAVQDGDQRYDLHLVVFLRGIVGKQRNRNVESRERNSTLSIFKTRGQRYDLHLFLRFPQGIPTKANRNVDGVVIRRVSDVSLRKLTQTNRNV